MQRHEGISFYETDKHDVGQFEDVGFFMNKERYIVQQWTGLHDKSNADIYIGDVVQLSGRDIFDLTKEQYVVTWGDRRAGIEFENTLMDRIFGNNDNWYNGYTVIGNICENPEFK